MEYQTIVKKVSAQQYTKPGCIRLKGIELVHYRNVGGYQGRLSYYRTPRNEMVPVRPNDWVVVQDGEVKIIDHETFTNTYELTKKPKKSINTVKQADNTNLVVPAT